MKTFTIQLAESQLCIAVVALWLFEQEQIQRANLAIKEGLFGQALASRHSATEALSLADKLSELVKAE
jgi:hypothetical protein